MGREHVEQWTSGRLPTGENCFSLQRTGDTNLLGYGTAGGWSGSLVINRRPNCPKTERMSRPPRPIVYGNGRLGSEMYLFTGAPRGVDT